MAVTENATETCSPGDLPAMEVASRVDRLRERLDATGIDGLAVCNLANVRYLTGFTGSSAMVLVTPARIVFVTDGRYRTQCEQQMASAGVDAEIEITADAPEVALAVFAKGLGHLGLEADTVTWSAQRRWSGELFDGELVATTGVVESLRMVKDHGEAVRIKAACAIADAALAGVRGRLLEGPTEREMARELDAAMLDLGAEEVSFETIVAAGLNGAKPHHRPSDRPIRPGDLVVIDFGAMVEGYHSDMTRTFAVGGAEGERRRMLDTVLEAQAAGVEAVHAGMDAAAVDAECRSVVEAAGLGDAFIHGTGHGVGLDIHEEPRLSTRSTATLAAGQVVTVEPGVYLPQLGGVRIEDTVLVTDGGCDRLTLAPKQPELT